MHSPNYRSSFKVLSNYYTTVAEDQPQTAGREHKLHAIVTHAQQGCGTNSKRCASETLLRHYRFTSILVAASEINCTRDLCGLIYSPHCRIIRG